MNIAIAASEAAPFVKTGGLGDVVQALSAELSRMPDNQVCVFLPYYRIVKENPTIPTIFLTSFGIPLAWRKLHVGLFQLKSRKKKLRVYFIDNEQYFDRARIYGEPDDGERFTYFSKAVLACLNHLAFHPKVVHCNDWQTALIPLLLKSEYADCFPGTKSVFTIHNVEYQGWTDLTFNREVLGLPVEYTEVLRFHDGINFMKSAVVMADAITSVSETYAQQILYPYYSHEMDQILRYYVGKLHGITNGIDTTAFNPTNDPLLVCNYRSIDAIEGKRRNKLALQRELGLQEDGQIALLGMVTRLVEHKGMDLMIFIADRLMQRRVQLVILGTGNVKYENYFRDFAERYPGRVCAHLQFNTELANRIYAAADCYLMPSRSEPCGLSQLIAMHYGAVPVVAATGGLRDTVPPFNPTDGSGCGFTFQSYNADDFLAAIDRCITVYYDQPAAWAVLVRRDMERCVSWKQPARAYMALYEGL